MPEHVESNTSSSTEPQTRPAYASPTAPAPRGKAPGMTYRLLAEHGGVREFVVILATGDEVMSGIHDFATREHITAARLTAVGALERVTVGWLDRERRAYLEHRVDEQVELVSLVGDVATHEGEPAPHVHVVVGLHDGTARGGHLIAATTYPTVELFVTAFPTSLQKRLDPASGVALIHPEPG